MVEIRAEIAANVWQVQVREGAVVAVGDSLVILESMKMEIPVIAEQASTVERVEVAEGQSVQPGDLLLILGVPR